MQAEIQAQAQALGLPISEALAGQLAAFAELLLVWNRTHSLTRLDTPRALVDDHTIDALAALPWLHEALQGAAPDAQAGMEAAEVGPVGHCLDVGSGNGYPAIPLALALPGVAFGMVERVARKAAFLRSAVAKLGLSGRVQVHETDVTRLAISALPQGRAPRVILSRAYAAPAAFVATTRHLAGPDTRLLYWAGAQELERWRGMQFPHPIRDNPRVVGPEPGGVLMGEQGSVGLVEGLVQTAPSASRPRAFLWLRAQAHPPQP